MNGCFSGNEMYSLEDIAAEFNLSYENPLLYGLYLSRNQELEEKEKAYIKEYMDKLIKKQNKINQRNIQYIERHLNEQK